MILFPFGVRNDPNNRYPGIRAARPNFFSINTPGGVVEEPTPQTATPAVSPASGTFGSSFSATITCSTPGATIYYTDDGSTPSSGSTPYTVPIDIVASTTIKAIAIKEGYVNSNIATADYVISGGGLLLDNLDGTAGEISGNADSGQARLASNGIIVLTGDGAAHLDDQNTPDIGLLQWDGLTVSDGSTIKVTLSAFEGQSPMVFFNTDFSFETPGGWAIFTNDDDNRVVLYDYTSVIQPNPGSNFFELIVGAGIGIGEAVEVTIALSGDSITLSAKGSSDTYTLTDRPYKNQTGFGVLFNIYNDLSRLYKVEVI